MVQGLASGSVGSWHEVPRTSLGLRSVTVVAGQTSPGRLATHLPQGSGRRGRARLGLLQSRRHILIDKTGKVRFL